MSNSSEQPQPLTPIPLEIFFEPLDVTVMDLGIEVGEGEQPTLGSQIEDKQTLGIREWVKKYRTRLAVGITAISATVTVAANPMGELTDSVMDAAPWVGGGIAVSEAAFIAGGAMMLAAIGSKIGNPLKVKNRIPEIAEKANDSMLFKTGFWMNAAGAVGDFAVISAGVLKELPVESYPLLSLTLLDLGGTIAVRQAIRGGIRDNLPDARPALLDVDQEGEIQ